MRPDVDAGFRRLGALLRLGWIRCQGAGSQQSGLDQISTIHSELLIRELALQSMRSRKIASPLDSKGEATKKMDLPLFLDF
jgi:hypothetical protein